jgi:hypothetical protein
VKKKMLKPTTSQSTASRKTTGKRSASDAHSNSLLRAVLDNAQASNSGNTTQRSTFSQRARSNLKNKKQETEAQVNQQALLQQEAEKKRKAEEEERKKMEKFVFGMRGKDYTYDNNGNIIMIKKVDASRLPTTMVKAKFSISGEPDEEEAVNKDDDKKRGRNRSDQNIIGRKEDKLAKKKEAHKVEIATYVTNTAPSQPMIEKLKPMKGVTLKEGKKILRGPPLEFDKSMVKSKRKNITDNRAAQETFKQMEQKQPKQSAPPPTFSVTTEQRSMTKEERSPSNAGIDQISSELSLPNRPAQLRKIASSSLMSRNESYRALPQSNNDDYDDTTPEDPPQPVQPQPPAHVWNRQNGLRIGDIRIRTKLRSKGERRESPTDSPVTPNTIVGADIVRSVSPSGVEQIVLRESAKPQEVLASSEVMKPGENTELYNDFIASVRQNPVRIVHKP